MTEEIFLSGRVVLHAGDSRNVIKGLADNSIDSVVTDPPYALNFKGKGWDNGEAVFDQHFWSEVRRVLKPGGYIVAFGASRQYHRMACAIEDAGFDIRDSLMWMYGSGMPKGKALKPAFEPIVMARKPISERTVNANVLRWRTGSINIDSVRIAHETINGGNLADNPHLRVQHKSYAHFSGGEGGRKDYVHSPLGRWPANVAHDGSDEVIYALSEFGGQPARFFYSAKASKADRAGSKHPTVKPVALMRWLCRMVTPSGGTLLDMFAGTGTTGEAAFREGFDAILVERETESHADIRRRMALIAPNNEGAETSPQGPSVSSKDEIGGAA